MKYEPRIGSINGFLESSINTRNNWGVCFRNAYQLPRPGGPGDGNSQWSHSMPFLFVSVHMRGYELPHIAFAKKLASGTRKVVKNGP
jgi:hypothetical protein